MNFEHGVKYDNGSNQYVYECATHRAWQIVKDEDKSFSLILLKEKQTKNKKKKQKLTILMTLYYYYSHHNFPETARPQYPHSLSDVEKTEDIFNRRPFPLEYSQYQFRSQEADLRKIFTPAIPCFFLLLHSRNLLVLRSCVKADMGILGYQ